VSCDPCETAASGYGQLHVTECYSD
jgi:hypothetical protein